MNEEYKKAIIDIATDDKNVKSVLALYKNEHRIKKRIIDDFVDILCSKAKEMGFVINVDDKFGDDAEPFISFCIPKQSDKWALFIGSDKRYAKDVYFGIYLLADKTSRIKKADLTNIPRLWTVFEQEKSCPCGWSYFWSRSGEKYSGRCYDWYDNETIEAMIDRSLLDFIVGNIFHR